MRIFVLLLSFSITVFINAQIPADSLPGTYVGKYYYASPSTNPWTISQDNFYPSSVDSMNCNVLLTGSSVWVSAQYYSDYYSCNGLAPLNHYIKFYNMDSVKWISDSTVQPWPNQPISYRFFGKRISAYVPFGIKKHGDQEIKIYPNPVSDVFTLQSRNELGSLSIYNLIGEIFYENKTNSLQEQVDVSTLPNGTYFLQLQTPEGTLTKKIIVQR